MKTKPWVLWEIVGPGYLKWEFRFWWLNEFLSRVDFQMLACWSWDVFFRDWWRSQVLTLAEKSYSMKLFLLMRWNIFMLHYFHLKLVIYFCLLITRRNCLLHPTLRSLCQPGCTMQRQLTLRPVLRLCIYNSTVGLTLSLTCILSAGT